MGSIAWLLVGALAGWGVILLAGHTRERGWGEHLLLGIVGAVLGGVLFSVVTGRRDSLAFTGDSVLVAALGALALRFLLRLLQRD